MEAQGNADDSVEFILEYRLPCIICGSNIEINNFIKQEVIELEEEQEAIREYPFGVGVNLESSLFHWFLKWFEVNIGKKGKRKRIERGWDGEGGDVLRFCVNCKTELMEILDFQKQLDELKQRLKNGQEKVKAKIKTFEKTVQTIGTYEKDPRYKLVRKQILKKCVTENSVKDSQGNSGSSFRQQVCRKRSRKSARVRVKTNVSKPAHVNSAIPNDAKTLMDRRTTIKLSSLKKASSDGQRIGKNSLAIIAKKIVQKKVSVENSAKLVDEPVVIQPVDNNSNQSNSSSLSYGDNANDQEPKFKMRRNNKWSYNLDSLTNTVTFKGIKFTIPENLEDKVYCSSCDVTFTNSKKR